MKSAILAAALTFWVASEAQSQAILHGDNFSKTAVVTSLWNQISYSVQSILPPPQQVSNINNATWNTAEKVVNKIDSLIDPFFRETLDQSSMSQQWIHKYNLKKIGDINWWNIQKESRSMNFWKDRSLLVGYSFLLSDTWKSPIRMDTWIQFQKSTIAWYLPVVNHTRSNVWVLIRVNMEIK